MPLGGRFLHERLELGVAARRRRPARRRRLADDDRRRTAACGRRTTRTWRAARIADAVAGHADDDDLRAVDLRFLLEHDQGPLVAALDDDRRLAERLDLLARQVGRQVGEAAVVPDQLVDVFRAW